MLSLLSPARDKEVAKAAIQAGADAIYIGAPAFGARQAAGNSLEDLAEVVLYAHTYGVQVLVTVNTLLLLTNGLKVYDLPYALTKGGPGYANYTVTQIIIQRGISERQYGVSTALAAIFILLVMIIAVIQYTTMSKREVDG